MRYVEKHYGEGEGTGGVLNLKHYPMQKNSIAEMELVQIKVLTVLLGYKG